jgi:aspartate kinase
VVLKVGGSILTGAKAYRRVARYLARRSETAPEEKLVVVVSAQELCTNTLERRARGIVRTPRPRTLDLLWSTGELRSVAILTLCLEAIDISSIGLNVEETGLRFSGTSGARPALDQTNLRPAIESNAIVVVPGFLATRADGATITLGRGGSDLTAVLLAVGLGALRCELLKDVPGYFDRDPRGTAEASHLPSLTFEEAMRMADEGCELVQKEALAAAAAAGLQVAVRSLKERAPVSVIHPNGGTVVSHQEAVMAEA